MIGFDPTKYPKDHHWIFKSINTESLLFSKQYIIKCINCNIEVSHEERIRFDNDELYIINSSFFVRYDNYFYIVKFGKNYIPLYDKVLSCAEMIIKNIIE